MSADFDFAPRTRLVFGAGSLARLGALVRELGARRVLLVTDRGLVAAGHAARAEASLAAAGCTHERFDAVCEDPDARDAAACAGAARAFEPELFVGLGGGSAIDVAKGANMLLTSGGRMQDYRGFGKTRAPLLPLVAVPTTAGTGSEVQSYALIADEETHAKMACGAADAAPRVALLDPELTLSLPRRVTACAGLDALGHALETAVTRKRNALSTLFSRAAWRLLCGAFPRVLAEPGSPAARADMLLGATYAGLAIELSMLGAAHSMANPLSARCGIVHGLAVGLALPHVVRFNAAEPEARAVYAELARSAGLAAHEAPDEAALEALVQALEGCLARAGFAPDLGAHGVRAELVPALAREASEQWTAQFNPRAVTAADFERLFGSAMTARA